MDTASRNVKTTKRQSKVISHEEIEAMIMQNPKLEPVVLSSKRPDACNSHSLFNIPAVYNPHSSPQIPYVYSCKRRSEDLVRSAILGHDGSETRQSHSAKELARYEERLNSLIKLGIDGKLLKEDET